MANAVFQRELKLGLRSSKAFLVQVLFVACLAAIVLLAWPKGEQVAIDDVRASALFRMLAASMFALVTLLSPVFVAASLTHEKEAGTLEMLLVSPIAPADIAWGKQIAGLLYVLMLVVTSLPVIGLCYFLGGVGGEQVFCLGVQLLGYACLLGGVGLLASHRCGRTHGALVVTYLVAIPLGVGMVLLAWNMPDFLSRWVTIHTGAVEAVAFGILFGLVVAGLGKPPATAQRTAEEERPEEQSVLQLQRHYFPDCFLWPERPKGYLPDGTNPVYTKEVTCEIFGRGTGLVRAILVGTLALSMVAGFSLPMRWPHIYFGYLSLCVLLIAPAFAANAFTQERERGTYDLLRTTLLTPLDILRGKLSGILRFLTVLLCFMLVPVVTVLLPIDMRSGSRFDTHSAFLFGLVLHFLIVLCTLLVSTATGLLMSLVFRRSAVAMIASYAAVFLFGVAPVAVFAVLDHFTSIETNELVWCGVTSPFLASLTVPWWEGQREFFESKPYPSMWMSYLTVALGAAVVALIVAWHRLRTDERRA